MTRTFLPVNQPYTMTPEQAAKAARTVRPKVLFPYHYSQTPIQRVADLLAGSGIDVRVRKPAQKQSWQPALYFDEKSKWLDRIKAEQRTAHLVFN